MLEVWNFIHFFFVTNGYIFEMLPAIFLFSYALKRRGNFVWRLILTLVLILTYSILWSAFVPVTAWTQIIKFLLFFAMFVFGIYFCMDISVWVALYCYVGASATQHCAFKTFSIIIALLGSTYDSNIAVPINFAVIATVYLLVFFFIARKIKSNRDKNFTNNQVVMLSFVLTVFTFIIHCILEEYIGLDNLPVFVMTAIYGIACCLFTLTLQYGFFKSNQNEREIEVMGQLIRLQDKQYRASKDNIDIINIKCHDLKQQISQLGNSLDAAAIEEIKQAISFYDATINTGNEILDVFLAEKRLLCEKDGIKFDCIADGKSIDFLTPSDVYSLFGNAIDNAIEAVRQLEEKEKRIINLQIRQNLNLVLIHVENYYKGDLDVVSGLPQTTKGDTAYHGYGMRSIKFITEKYKGNMTIVTENETFNLNILLWKPN